MGTHNIHAGHGKQDSKSCGAYTGLLAESVENRPIKDELIRLLREHSNTVYDCTVDYPTNQSDCINRIVKLCNAHKTDLDASIHFNSGRNNVGGDGKIGGVEIVLYDNSKNSPVAEANRILKKMEALGFTNRGIKYNKNLGYLRDTIGRSMIIEICFVDDADDVKLYKKLGHKVIAKAIAEGILNKTISESNHSEAIAKKYAVLINSYADIIKAKGVACMLKHDDNLFNEVIPYGDKYAIKIYPLSPRSKAEGIQKLVSEKYNAYSDIIEL